jgi:hypothetical protein
VVFISTNLKQVLLLRLRRWSSSVRLASLWQNRGG